MLYYKSKNENNNNQVYIPDCCNETDPSNPLGCDCCFDSWTVDLIATTNSFKEWDAKATKRQKLFDFKSAWSLKLKSWYDDLEGVDQKAEMILRQVEIFIAHLNKICKITEQSNHTIQILFCMIKDLYKRVDELKEEYDELMNCIASAAKTNPELSNGIVACLTDYGKKLDAVIGTRDALIIAVGAVIETAYKLHEYLCLNEAHCGEDKVDYGLINILMYWKGIFTGTIAINHGDCKFNPCITFPLDASDYYKKLDNDWKKNKEEVKVIKHDLDHAKQKRAAFLASKDSLTRALMEVDPTVKCK